jgi:MFS family permease
MTSEPPVPPAAAPPPPPDRSTMRRLMLFFGIVYVVEGFGQTGGLIAQPLAYFLKEFHGWTAVQVTAFLTIFNLPWVIKPLYGAVSDFIPLFGYRRKSYLILANVAAACAFLWVAQATEPSHLAFALLLTAYAMAISSTLCGGLLVENGQKFGVSGRLVNQQWLWFNVATMIAAVVGGQLVQRLPPTAALHAAAAVLAVAPLALIWATWSLVEEEKSAINLPELKKTFRGLVSAFRSRKLWVVALFLFLYYFSPGFGTPLYYHMTDNLKFSQGYIGILGSIASGGWIIGAVLYDRYLDGLPSRTLLNLSIALGTLTTASFLLLSTETSAAILNFCSGFAAMLATVATLRVAAEFCPPRSEGFAFAVLTSITNLAVSAADNVGSLLYERVFHHDLTPLIVVSAAATAVAFALVPLLGLGGKQQTAAPVAA